MILRGKGYVSQYLVTHEFINRRYQGYRQEGIEIPYPIRTVHVRTPELARPQVVKGDQGEIEGSRGA